MAGDRLNDPFARVAAPTAFDRADRVRLLLLVADALVEGTRPPRAAALFVGGALQAWLADDRHRSLTRDFLAVTGPRGCRVTPQLLARKVRASRRR